MLRTAQNKACDPALPKNLLTPTCLIHSLLPIHLVGVFGAQVFGDGHVQMLIGQAGHAAAAGGCGSAYPSASGRVRTHLPVSFNRCIRRVLTFPFYAFQYKYDSRNRCIEKEASRCGRYKICLRLADNLVFSQDGNQRVASLWTFYLYDKFQRADSEKAYVVIPIHLQRLRVLLPVHV
mgnify:CR=1 FL=1